MTRAYAQGARECHLPRQDGGGIVELTVDRGASVAQVATPQNGKARFAATSNRPAMEIVRLSSFNVSGLGER